LHVLPVSVHRVDIKIAVARRREHNMFSVASNSGLGVVARRVAKKLRVAAIVIRRVDAVGIVDRPDVAARVVRLRRAFGACSMGGRKKNPLSRREKVTASRAAFAGTEKSWSSRPSVRGHHRNRINLVARNTSALVLKNQSLIVRRKISFSVLAAECKLPHVFQM